MKDAESQGLKNLDQSVLDDFKAKTERYSAPAAAIIDEPHPERDEQLRQLDSYLNLSERFRALARSQGQPEVQVDLGLKPRVRTWENLWHTPVAGSAEVVAEKAEVVKERIEPDVSAFERIVGVSDLLPLWYLERGRRAARSVGIIRVKGERIGTGFLVGEQLLLTNNHVLGATPDGLEEVEFDFEQDEYNRDKVGPTAVFRLDRNACFITSDEHELDFTLIGVAATSVDSTAELKEFGFLRLDPEQGKIEVGEAVGIIGHPNAGVKQISLRDNRVLKIGFPDMDHLIWYTTDTQPGNSGSPVFNDQWQVVALHHSGVPDPCPLPDGSRGVKTGSRGCVPENALQRSDTFSWIANEGVRISFIVKACRIRLAAGSFPLVDRWLADMAGNGQPYANWKPQVPVPLELAALERGGNALDPHRFDDRDGYEEDFLNDFDIPLPSVPQETQDRFGPLAALLRQPDQHVLKYTHSSIVMNAKRRIAYFTAVNIDGDTWRSLPRVSDKWSYDDRLSRDHQVGNELYADEPGAHGWFDRGHLVRRQDPVWGSSGEAKRANDDTFVWTNCSPQYWQFNQAQEFWQGVENYILDNLAKDRLKACVFSGPVFSEQDELHRDIPIPKFYWKVVAVQDKNDQLHVSAYRVDQTQYAKDIPFERLPVGPFEGWQVSLASLAQDTGLVFPDVLLKHDVWQGQAPERFTEASQVKITRTV